MTPLPLASRTVLVTRAREQAEDLTRRLTALGAGVMEFPAIRFVAPETWDPLDDALDRAAAGGYDWVVFTSVNGVRFAAERRPLASALASPRLAAIGPATAAALTAHGLRVERIPAEFRAEGVVDALASDRLDGARVLLVRASVARDVLPQALAARGAQVDVRVAYRTLEAGADAAPVRDALARGALDAATFASSSTVDHVVAALGDDAVRLLGRTAIVCIGPITGDAIRAHGLTVRAEARAYTIPGLVDAVVRALAGVAA